jgi:hypothetical protein
MAPKKVHLSIDEQPHRCTEPKVEVEIFRTLLWMPKVPDVSIYRSALTWIRYPRLASFSRSDSHSSTISTSQNHAKRAPGLGFQPASSALGLIYTPFTSAQF